MMTTTIFGLFLTVICFAIICSHCSGAKSPVSDNVNEYEDLVELHHDRIERSADAKPAVRFRSVRFSRYRYRSSGGGSSSDSGILADWKIVLITIGSIIGAVGLCVCCVFCCALCCGDSSTKKGNTEVRNVNNESADEEKYHEMILANQPYVLNNQMKMSDIALEPMENRGYSTQSLLVPPQEGMHLQAQPPPYSLQDQYTNVNEEGLHQESHLTKTSACYQPDNLHPAQSEINTLHEVSTDNLPPPPSYSSATSENTG